MDCAPAEWFDQPIGMLSTCLSIQGYQQAGPLSLADLEEYYLRWLPKLNAEEDLVQEAGFSKMLKCMCSAQMTKSEEDNRQLLYVPYLDDILLEQAEMKSQTGSVINSVLGDPRVSELWLMILFCSSV